MKKLLSILFIPLILHAEVRPQVLIYSGTHGDEQVANAIVHTFRKELAQPHTLTIREQQILKQIDVICINNINVQGLAKNHRETVRGVDPNRDYGFWWDGEGNSPYPWSQPEVQQFASLVDHKRISLSIDIHDGMTKLLYPWGAVPFGVPDSAIFAGIVQSMPIPSFLAERFHPYYKGQFYHKIYQSCGTTMDYLYGSKGVTAFLIETSLQRSVDSSFQKIYADHRPILWRLIEAANAGIAGTVKSTSGEAIEAIVTAVDEKGNALWPVSTYSLGYFHKITANGTYSLRIEASGYRTRIVKPFQLYRNRCQTIAVTLNKSNRTQNFAHRIAAVQWPSVLGNTKLQPFPFKNRTVAAAVIGNPDGDFYSLEHSGSIIVDFGRQIPISPRSRLLISEKGFPEGYRISVSSTLFQNPFTWRSLGFRIGSTTISFPKDCQSVRYVRIADDGIGLKRKQFSGADIESVLLQQ